jgi:hypothetical protein
MTATETTARKAMQDAQAVGKKSEADLIDAGIAALVKTGMSEANARAVANIVYGAPFKVWGPV